MVPSWLHNLAIAYLLFGASSVVVIAIDVIRHPQHMWIMDVVWLLTALFGTAWILWQYFTCGRLATRAKAQAAMQRYEEPPNKRPTPFPVMTANDTLHCGSGRTLGDICAEWLIFAAPAAAVAFGWHGIFGMKISAARVLDYVLAYLFGIVFQYFAHRADARTVRGAGSGRGDQGCDTVHHVLAGRHVRLHGHCLFRDLQQRPGCEAGDRHGRVLVHDADRDVLRVPDELSGQLVAAAVGHQGTHMTGLRHCVRCRAGVSSRAMPVGCRALRLILAVLMLLGSGAWVGHVAARSLPDQIAVACNPVPACAADQQTPSMAVECSGMVCVGAILSPDRVDVDLRRRRVAGIRYAASQHAGLRGIHPQPAPFPPKWVVPID